MDKRRPHWRLSGGDAPSDEASTPERFERERHPLAGHVCGACGWIYINSATTRRSKPCTKCKVGTMRIYLADARPALEDSLLGAECASGKKRPATVKKKFRDAIDRFHERKDDLQKAQEIVARKPSSDRGTDGLVRYVYNDLQKKRHSDKLAERHKPKPNGTAKSKPRGAPKTTKPKVKKKPKVFGEGLGKKSGINKEARRAWLRKNSGDASGSK